MSPFNNMLIVIFLLFLTAAPVGCVASNYSLFKAPSPKEDVQKVGRVLSVDVDRGFFTDHSAVRTETGVFQIDAIVSFAGERDATIVTRMEATIDADNDPLSSWFTHKHNAVYREIGRELCVPQGASDRCWPLQS